MPVTRDHRAIWIATELHHRIKAKAKHERRALSALVTDALNTYLTPSATPTPATPRSPATPPSAATRSPIPRARVLPSREDYALTNPLCRDCKHPQRNHDRGENHACGQMGCSCRRFRLS